MDGIVLRSTHRSPGLVDSKRSGPAVLPGGHASALPSGPGSGDIRQHRDVVWFDLFLVATPVAQHRLVVDFFGQRPLPCQRCLTAAVNNVQTLESKHFTR